MTGGNNKPEPQIRIRNHNQMKRKQTILWALAVWWLFSFPAQAGTFIQGADVSFLPQIEEVGGVYQSDGVPNDCLSILRDHGLDTIRLRLWHNPGEGHSGLAETLALAERVRCAGFNLMLDFHYSDTWADPGHQTKPAAWESLPLTVLADSVRCYTRDVLVAFESRGCVPTMVQIGNEISSGMLWDEGRVGGGFATPQQWSNLGELLQAE